jgi:hypothetical protein
MAKQHELIIAQLQAYPDSKLLTPDEAIARWVDGPIDTSAIEAEFEEFWGDMKDEGLYREFKAARIIERLVKSRMQVLRTITMMLTGDYEAVQFYECIGTDDGKFRWRGCRYGVEEHEYMSGFGPWW